MPHVVLGGSFSLDRAFDAFRPFVEREGDEVRKVERCFLEKGGDTLLLETMVVSGRQRQKFLIQLGRRAEAGWILRLDPLTDPEKTDAVKRCLGMVVRWLRASFPDLRIEKTNIGPHLEGPR